jgi:hypothetical protein
MFQGRLPWFRGIDMATPNIPDAAAGSENLVASVTLAPVDTALAGELAATLLDSALGGEVTVRSPVTYAPIAVILGPGSSALVGGG